MAPSDRLRWQHRYHKRRDRETLAEPQEALPGEEWPLSLTQFKHSGAPPAAEWLYISLDLHCYSYRVYTFSV